MERVAEVERLNKGAFFRHACEEPYRIFFPLGLLVGISGVTLWPLFFSGIHRFHPGVMHARLMVEGFMAAFVFGFLGTAGPRLSGTAPFSRWELSLLLALYGGVTATHIAERYWLGDLLFLAALLFFAVILGRRFATSKRLPPPGFALVGLGFLCAIAGTAALVASQLWTVDPRVFNFGTAFLNQVWILFLVLGVGSFILPRFLQIPPPLTGLGTPAGWRGRALRAVAVGVAIMAAYIADLFVTAPRVTALIRFGVAAAYVLYQIGAHRGQAPRVTITRCLSLAIGLTVAGLFFPVPWPAQRVAGLHVVFIGGFSLITLTVATRVVLGHGGFGFLFARKLPFLIATTLLLLAGMALRVGGDFAASWRGWAISLGALLWIAGAIVWGCRVLPKVRFHEPET